MKYAQQLITRMTWRSTSMLALAFCVSLAVACPAQEGEKPEPRIRYVPLDTPIDSPASLFKTAVIVDKMPLVHTRQLFPFDSAGTCPSSSDKQIEQVLANLETVLKDSGSEMSKLIRVNVYALSTSIVTSFHQQLSNRLDANVRPAITSVLTPLPHRGVVIAVDAVAGAADSGEGVLLKRCKAVAGNDHVADAAVLPAGGIAYLSGHPEEFDLTTLPTTKSMTQLMKTLGQLNLAPEHVVQVKVFLNPITKSEAVLREVQTFFPDLLAPPIVFVEWLASMPVEIEMIAHLPPADGPSEAVQYFDPPEFRPSNAFSRVALMQADQQIYLAGLYAQEPRRGQQQADLLFGQLNDVLKRTGSDLRHLVKATYYVSDDDAARWVDRTRPKVFDPARPPAASKLMVHGVGHPERTMTIDMIAVVAE